MNFTTLKTKAALVAAWLLLAFGGGRVAQAVAPYLPYQGGTGTSTAPTQGQVLVGTSGGVYAPVATSTLGITAPSSTILGDSNLFTGQNRFNATTTFTTTTVASSSITNANITTLTVGTCSGCSLPGGAFLADTQIFTGLNTFNATTTFSTSTAASSTINNANIGALKVSGNSTLSGTLNAGATTLASLNSGAATLSSLGVTNDATVGGTFGVTGATTLTSATQINSTLGVSNLATLTSGFIASASSTVSANLTVGGILNALATTTFSQGFMASGTIGVTRGSGPGTRLEWIPAKAALRGGHFTGTEADDSNIGYNTFAYGEQAIAAANNSVSIGYYPQVTATGLRSISLGSGSTVKAVDSSAVGQNNYIESTASGSAIVGNASSAYGVHNSILGYLNITEGAGSATVGVGGDNLGNNSVLVALNGQYAPASKTVNLPDTFVVLGGNSSFGDKDEAPSVVNITATSTPANILRIKGKAGGTGNYIDVINSDSVSLLKMNAAGHLSTSSTQPVLSSCGTGPSLRGTDTAGEITVGSTATSCTLTFHTAFTNAPTCTVSFQSTLAAETYSYTTAALTIGATALGGTKVNYNCLGINE